MSNVKKIKPMPAKAIHPLEPYSAIEAKRLSAPVAQSGRGATLKK